LAIWLLLVVIGLALIVIAWFIRFFLNGTIIGICGRLGVCVCVFVWVFESTRR